MQRTPSSNSFSPLISFANSIFDDEDFESSDFESDNDFIHELSDYLESESEYLDEKINDMDHSTNITNEDQKIYKGSDLNTKQYGFIFLFLVHKMKLPQNQIDNLFRFIKYILPEDNCLPSSYESVVKSYLKDSIKPTIIKMCYFCEMALIDGLCNNKDCSKPASLPKGVRKNYETIIFDANQQIRDVLERNWQDIQEYKGKFLITHF